MFLCYLHVLLHEGSVREREGERERGRKREREEEREGGRERGRERESNGIENRLQQFETLDSFLYIFSRIRFQSNRGRDAFGVLNLKVGQGGEREGGRGRGGGRWEEREKERKSEEKRASE